MISFPCTTRLSFDFFRSLVSISKKATIVSPTSIKKSHRERKHTITTHLSIDDIPNAHINHAEESLILLLEFLLVENLDGKDTVFVDTAVFENMLVGKRRGWRPCKTEGESYRSKISFQYGFRVFLMTDVVWVCSPPTVATANGSGNPIDLVSWQGYQTTRTARSRHTKNISFV